MMRDCDQEMPCHLARAAIGGAALSLLWICSAPAQTSAQPSYLINIPAEPLPRAIAELSRQTGLQVLYTGSQAFNHASHAVNGQLVVEEALRRMLQGTGIGYRFVRTNAVTLDVQGHARADAPPPANGSIMLDTIDVQAKTDGNSGNGAYSSPAPVSSVSGSDLALKTNSDVSTAMRSIPGVFTLQPADQPGIATNIRGLEGYGRVNTMIDGVPQSFRNVAGHGSSGGTLTYVDPNLLSGIDVERGVVSGAAGAGTLAGAVNMHTIGLDDVLLPGRNWGGMTRLTAGTNGRDYSALFAGGVRTKIGDDGMAGFVGAFTTSNINFYKNGDGKIPAGFNTSNEPQSGLAKLTYKPTADQRIDLGGRWYRNEFVNSSYNWIVTNNTYTLDYALHPADSDLVDLNVHGFINESTLAYPLHGKGGSYRGRSTDDTEYGVNFDNTSRFSLGNDVNLKLFYGASWHKDHYEVNERRGGNFPGDLVKASAFSDTTVSWGIYSLTGGLRYDHWSLDGYQPPVQPGWANCPADGPTCGDKNIRRSGGQFDPRITATAQPLNWLQVYATYARTFRPPTIPEMFFSLIPIGAGTGTGAANNLDLRPESSRSLDLGANINKRDLLFDKDELHIKFGFFDNAIKNFIVNDFIEVPGRGTTAMWVNRPGTTHMNGVEIEGRYDAGFFYVNGSYARSNTAQPIGQGAGWGNGLYGEQPKQTAMLDVGTRWFDQRLTVGAIMRYTGSSAEGYGDLFGEGPTLRKLPSYTLFDAYASFKLNENATVFASVENITDKTYTPADSYEAGQDPGSTSSKTATGRGRTFVAGATLRF